MHSVSLNSYNSGAAAKGVVAGSGVVAGGNRRHTDYGVTNREWTLVNDVELWVYLYSLGIVIRDDAAGNFQRIAMWSYMGVDKFYSRSVYDRDRHQYVHGDVCNLDPWNRVFPMFPGCNKLSGFGGSGYRMLYDYERFHSNLWGDADDVYNVIVLSTSVCGYRVYCVDVLS